MELEFQKILVLSTAHLTEEDNDFLSNEEYSENLDCVIDETPYGWMVHISKNKDELFSEVHRLLSENFRKAMELAFINDCDWVRFDCDGNVVEELKSYDW